ncbi:tetratricopeptide repeat protein [Magnetospirillum sp. SS-4]|uniref:O-linked N-acetylglucosamine transferase, SPINDLY family protein n=1 Tax=Magnetospirillum sp. SS-4 TaxID=2681465 RepID=UPI00138150D6|nr:tetratricopeptide repeat protein [Magnetospirillum sp. SS-4]CAA7623929.1 conserved hypothetical protein [Magnetospirillum sp. SS-4]
MPPQTPPCPLCAKTDRRERGRKDKDGLRLYACGHCGAGFTALTAWERLGESLMGAGRPADAEAAFRQAVALAPRAVSALNNLGATLTAQNRSAEALAFHRKAVALDPGNPVLRYNLARCLQGLKEHGQAIDELRAVIRARPDLAQAHVAIGLSFKALHLFADAEAAFRQAIGAAPDQVEGWANLATHLKMTGRIPEGQDILRRIVAAGRASMVIHSNYLFGLTFDSEATAERELAECQDFDRRFIRPLAARLRPHANERDPDRPLRIGYVSPYFRNSPAGNFLKPLFAHTDRDRFRIVSYSHGPGRDDMTEEFRRLSDEWRDAAAMDDPTLAERIRADGVDILVDCGGHMADNRIALFGLKPAPVQVSFPLYPGTTGISTMDYRLMDARFAPPWADAGHSEKIVRLPHAHVCYQPGPNSPAPPDRPPCDDEGVVTFGCFNNFAKLGEATLAAWAELLRRVPASRLSLKWMGIGQGVEDHVAQALERLGVGPDSLILSPWTDNPYEPYLGIDIGLDPLYPNGGTTTCDALWMGVPVVSCAGTRPFGRVGLCLLSAVGLPELAAGSAEDYIALAAALATDRDRLRRLRAGLRQRMAASPLMDAPLYAGAVSSAYRIMWRRWCAGLPPAAFSL